jgi:ferredoxin
MKIDDQNNKNIKKSKPSINRRTFLGLGGKIAIVIAFGGLIRLLERDNKFERPLTALPEDEFLTLCSRCQKCIAVCPYKATTPVLLSESVTSAGTPKLVSSCLYGDKSYMGCPGYCAMECPTGALRL